MLDRPEGTGPTDTRLGLVHDQGDGPLGGGAAHLPHPGVGRRKHPGPDRVEDGPGGACRSRRPVLGRGPGPVAGDRGGEHPGPADGGTGRRGGDGEGGGDRVLPGRFAEADPGTAREAGRQRTGQFGDEGALDGGGEVHDLEGGSRVQDLTDRPQDDRVVVPQGQRARAADAVEVTAAVRTLDGQSPGADRDDRQDARTCVDRGVAHRPARRGSLAHGPPAHCALRHGTDLPLSGRVRPAGALGTVGRKLSLIHISATGQRAPTATTRDGPPGYGLPDSSPQRACLVRPLVSEPLPYRRNSPTATA